MRARSMTLSGALLLALCSVACGDEGGLEADAVGSGATLEGRVVLAEGFELPRYRPAELSRRTLMPVPHGDDPKCADDVVKHSGIALGAERAVEGVVVAAAEFVRYRRRKPRVHVVTLEGCQLSPRTVVAQLGDRLRVENRDQSPHRFTFGPAVEPGQLHAGDDLVLDLHRVGIEPLLCAQPTRCGRTDVVVLYHPVATVTDAEGRFRFEDFPVDESVVVGAWHPLLTESRTTLWLTPGQVARTTLPVKPHDAPAPAEEEPVD